MTLWETVVAAGIPETDIDHHESDLYLRDTPEVRAIIGPWRKQAYPFTSRLGDGIWFDFPFSYEPFWEKKVSQRK